MSLEQLAELVKTPTAANKSDLPWLKLATFGKTASERGCLRHDANVEGITGVEVDYDGEELSFETACELVRKANVFCLLYTSPSYTKDKPRFRMVAPLSAPVRSGLKGVKRTNELRGVRERHVARLDGIIGNVAANESYALSQSYFFGSVKGGTPVMSCLIEGRYIDECDDLDPKRPRTPKQKEAAPASSGTRPYRADLTDEQILEQYAFPSANGERLKRLHRQHHPRG